MKIQFCILLFVLSGFTTTRPAPSVSLKYSFKTGDQFEYIQHSKQIVRQNIPGMGEMKHEADISGVMEMKVLSTSSAGATIEAKYSTLKMDMKSPVMNMNFDNEGSQEEVTNKIAKAMMGKTFSFTMNVNGKVEKVEGAQNLFSGFGDIGLDAATVEAYKKTMEQTMNDKTLEGILANGFIVYPDKKVNEGDTWTTTTMQTTSMPFQVDNTWSLGKVDGTTATVTADAKMATVASETPTTLPNGMKTKTDLSGTQMVSGLVDVKTGWPTEVKVSSTLKGNMTLLAGGMIPEDMLVPMEMQIETTYKIRKK